MNVVIETEAFKSFFLGILSCKCPVTQETEKKLFDYYLGAGKENTLNFNGIMAIANQNPHRTPMHNLFDFCAGSKDDPFCFTINTNDVLRYLGSLIHYNMVTSNHPGIESDNPALLISHILTPVTIEKNEDVIEAVYTNQDAVVRFTPVVIPMEPMPDSRYYAHHMGMILCRLSNEQADMLNAHQQLFTKFKTLAKGLGRINLRALPPHGDHLSNVMERLSRYPI